MSTKQPKTCTKYIKRQPYLCNNQAILIGLGVQSVLFCIYTGSMMKSKKERIQFEDGEKIEFPTIEEKPVVEGIILPKNLFSSNNELIHPLKLKEAKLAKIKEREAAKKKEKIIKKKVPKKIRKAVIKKKKPVKKAPVKKEIKKAVVKKHIVKAKPKPVIKSTKTKVTIGSKKKSIFSMFGKKK